MPSEGQAVVEECKKDQSSDSVHTVSDESEEIDYEDDPLLTREENEF